MGTAPGAGCEGFIVGLAAADEAVASVGSGVGTAPGAGCDGFIVGLDVGANAVGAGCDGFIVGLGVGVNAVGAGCDGFIVGRGLVLTAPPCGAGRIDASVAAESDEVAAAAAAAAAALVSSPCGGTSLRKLRSNARMVRSSPRVAEALRLALAPLLPDASRPSRPCS